MLVSAQTLLDLIPTHFDLQDNLREQLINTTESLIKTAFPLLDNLQDNSITLKEKEKINTVTQSYLQPFMSADTVCGRLLAGDYYTAPASTIYHLSIEGGLALHTLNVIEHYLKLLQDDLPPVAGFICALVHDWCKIGTYKITQKFTPSTVPGQKWQKYYAYSFDDKFPLGHGEKSLYLASQFFRLSEVQALAIRYHMGPFTNSLDNRSYYNAIAVSPAIPKLYLADYLATVEENFNMPKAFIPKRD